MADSRNLRNYVAPPDAIPQFKHTSKHLWEVFPDYSLSEDFGANVEELATIKQCYEPMAVRWRIAFLYRADIETSGAQCAVRISDDLFGLAGKAYEAHLRNCSLSDLGSFVNQEQSDPLLKLSAFFKPRGDLSPQAWETMAALLTKVWEWALKWRLGHYSYVHFACLALIEGHWFCLPKSERPLVRPNQTGISIPLPSYPLHDPRQDEDFIQLRFPDGGWLRATELLDLPARTELNNQIPAAPKGCQPYGRALFINDTADEKLAQENYAKWQMRIAQQAIDSTVLACLKGTQTKLLDNLVETVGKVAREYAKGVNLHYYKAKVIAPSQFHRKHENEIAFTVERVILRREWKEIGAKPQTTRRDRQREDAKTKNKIETKPRTTIESIVERAASKLYLPKESYRWRLTKRATK